MGLDWATSLMRYGERWRAHRRVLHQKFNIVAAVEYQPIQHAHTRSIRDFCFFEYILNVD
jgi:hypothetical protein